MSQRCRLILERGSPKPVSEIGQLLACHLPVQPMDAIASVRYGGGFLADDIPEETADALRADLEDLLGVRCRKIDADRSAVVPHGYRAFALEFRRSDLVVRLVTSKIVIPLADVRGLHLYALRRPEEASPQPAGNGVPLPSERELLSARATALIESLAQDGAGPVEFYLTLYCSEPFGPVRVRRSEFDFTCLGDEALDHSLDNFLLLIDRVLDRLPHLWHRQAAQDFLSSLDVRRILYFKPEEAESFDRWNLLWIQLEAEERLLARPASAVGPESGAKEEP